METLAPTVEVIAAAHIVVQNFECQGHNQGAAMAVHNGFWQARGAT